MSKPLPSDYKTIQYPVCTVIDGVALVATQLSASVTEPEVYDLMPQNSLREGRFPQRDESTREVSIHLTYKGRDAYNALSVIQRLFAN